jgi:hypothetical protein
MSNNNWDAFGDIQDQTQGVFSGGEAALQPGFLKHRAVHTLVARTGVKLQFDCQVCGQPTVVEMEWPEVVALKYGVNPLVAFQSAPGMLAAPTRWEYIENENDGSGGWRPDVNCRSCNKRLDLLVEPHEPERLLAGARRRGFINPGGEAQVSNICAAAASGGQMARR